MNRHRAQMALLPLVVAGVVVAGLLASTDATASPPRVATTRLTAPLSRAATLTTQPERRTVDGGVPEAMRALMASSLHLQAGEVTRTLSGLELLALSGIDPEATRVVVAPLAGAQIATALGATWVEGLARLPVGSRYSVDADGDGRIQAVVPDLPGATLDLEGSAELIRAQLTRLVRRPAAPTVALPMSELRHDLSAEQLEELLPQLTLLGAEEVRYTPMASNGYAENILIPGRVFAGQALAPGEWFDFWVNVGPVTRAAGYRNGGAFINGRVDPTGAFAGGICATATAIYAAAARAGLEIGTRYPHYSYLSRYPLGLDATVWKTKRAEKTVRFRNDTAHPIVIVVRQRPGFLRVEIHGVDDGRATTIAVGPLRNRRIGPNGMIGGSVIVTRTVVAADGRTLHRDQISSSYNPY